MSKLPPASLVVNATGAGKDTPGSPLSADAVFPERALVWDAGRGFFHDGPPASQEVVSRFDDAAAELPEDVRRQVREKMHEFAGSRIAVTARRKRFRRAEWQR